MTYASEVLADSPYVYLKLNETSGTAATDSSGNSRTGTYVGSPTLGVTGLVPTSADLAVQLASASSQTITVPDDNGLDAISAFTVEAWIKPTTVTGVMIAARDGITANRSFQFSIQSGKLTFIRIPGSIVTATGGTTLVSGTVYHVVAVYNGTDIRLYVNGVLDNTPAACTGTMGSSAEVLRIGSRRNTVPTTVDYYNGVLDEFAAYTTALSSARISAHYAAGTGAIVSPPAATATAAGAVPVVSAGSSVASVAATATAAGVVPVVSGSSSVAAVAATATAAAVAPTLSIGATVSPPAATATAAAVAPTVSATGTANVTPPAATATATALPPSLVWDNTVSAVVATAAAAALVPTVSAGATVAAPAATATAVAFPPTVSSVSADATVLAVKATATATALAPSVAQVWPSGTDTSNVLTGRNRRARASATVTRPASSTPSRVAVKYDKSVPLPPPVLVDGRLT